MSNKMVVVPRKHATHGVVQRDVTLQYNREMERRYGYNWKKKLKQNPELLKILEKDGLNTKVTRQILDLPPVKDMAQPDIHLEDSE